MRFSERDATRTLIYKSDFMKEKLRSGSVSAKPFAFSVAFGLRYANAKRGHSRSVAERPRPQLPLKANAPKTIDFRGLTKSMICSFKFRQNYLDLGELTNPFTCEARR
ncbi:hypothetical protein BJP34_13410 [Moorena producens PAL-8-15-08-1]|uniref:Uncharacterized protein n=1 Tax=Moorena producens PAL-8-15-08-1 TaxID=1458985 RepID=A0A1D8TRP3_9CYAN|nr:hypothetical protein BJP34_13410 [Moorena producens PAL-8-15-08-1]